MKNKEPLTIQTLIHELSKFPKDCWDLPIRFRIGAERIPEKDLFFTKDFIKEDILDDLIEVGCDDEVIFHLSADEIEDFHNPAMLLEDYIDFENLEERVIQKYKRNKKRKDHEKKKTNL